MYLGFGDEITKVKSPPHLETASNLDTVSMNVTGKMPTPIMKWLHGSIDLRLFWSLSHPDDDDDVDDDTSSIDHALVKSSIKNYRPSNLGHSVTRELR